MTQEVDSDELVRFTRALALATKKYYAHQQAAQNVSTHLDDIRSRAKTLTREELAYEIANLRERLEELVLAQQSTYGISRQNEFLIAALRNNLESLHYTSQIDTHVRTQDHSKEIEDHIHRLEQTIHRFTNQIHDQEQMIRRLHHKLDAITNKVGDIKDKHGDHPSVRKVEKRVKSVREKLADYPA